MAPAHKLAKSKLSKPKSLVIKIVEIVEISAAGKENIIAPARKFARSKLSKPKKFSYKNS